MWLSNQNCHWNHHFQVSQWLKYIGTLSQKMSELSSLSLLKSWVRLSAQKLRQSFWLKLGQQVESSSVVHLFTNCWNCLKFPLGMQNTWKEGLWKFNCSTCTLTFSHRNPRKYLTYCFSKITLEFLNTENLDSDRFASSTISKWWRTLFPVVESSSHFSETVGQSE